MGNFRIGQQVRGYDEGTRDAWVGGVVVYEGVNPLSNELGEVPVVGIEPYERIARGVDTFREDREYSTVYVPVELVELV